MANSWIEVQKLGQSLWYDNMSRSLVSRKDNGPSELAGMMETLGVRGITSNPAIFEKSIANGRDYDYDIEQLGKSGLSTEEIYERLTTDDIRNAADILRSVYDATDGHDGFVSIEVDPTLSAKTEESIHAAQRIWRTIDRPNVMIKIPGTPEGIPAVRALLEEGINVNITLLFGLDNYSAVANAYIDAIKARMAKGKDVKHIASVASFFLSRVDTNVDAKLDKMIADSTEEGLILRLKALRGQAANANAKLAYERFGALFQGDDFAECVVAGARVQRCLWASVGTKNKAYSDVMYIEPLIGPDTVTTVPDETLAAFLDHGTAANTLGTGLTAAHLVIDSLAGFGIDTEKVAEELQIDGVKKFEDAFRGLLANLESKRATVEATIEV